MRHVKGSHIVVPRVHAEAHAYILQNADKRIVFVIPYQEHYSLIGTTDIPVEAFEHPADLRRRRRDYLLDLANTYLERPLSRSDIVWTYSGVRPLYDDGSDDPSAVTRDYVLKVDALRRRRRARSRPGAVDLRRQDHDVPQARRACAARARAVLPGIEAAHGRRARRCPAATCPTAIRAAWVDELARALSRDCRDDVLRGACAVATAPAPCTCWATASAARRPRASTSAPGLTAREVDYLVREEWARTADDVLWRRTKCGLPMTPAQRAAVADYIAGKA